MVNELQIDEQLAFSASTAEDINFGHEEFQERVGTGFNEHGVRENRENGELQSVDVIFEAMEPGPPERRNGVRITEDFLENVAEKSYDSNPPHLKDHDTKDTFSRIGEVKDAWFSSRLNKLMLMTRTPNVQGSRNHQEAIARYTHDPPEIRDGSLGFGRNYKAEMNDDGEPEMVDGKFREFSTVNFPGGYDDGGVATAFAEAAQEAVDDGEVLNFDEHQQQVFEAWNSLVNMDEDEMEMWENHPCSDVGVDNGSEVRDNTMMLMGQAPDGWNDESYRVANQIVAWARQNMDQMPDDAESGGKGTCPAPMAVHMLNRGINPFGTFPSGNPTFSEDSVESTVITFDDPSGGENLATDPAVETNNITF